MGKYLKTVQVTFTNSVPGGTKLPSEEPRENTGMCFSLLQHFCKRHTNKFTNEQELFRLKLFGRSPCWYKETRDLNSPGENLARWRIMKLIRTLVATQLHDEE